MINIKKSIVKVVIRKFGDNDIDRNFEHDICCALSQFGICPNIYLELGHLRIEQFLDAESLKYHELSIYIEDIFINFAKLHKIDIPNSNRDGNYFFDMTEKYFGIGKSVSFMNDEKKQLLKELDISEMEREYYNLKNALKGRNFDTCFCHNDLNAGNVLVNKENNKLYFIDFEYAGYNYRGFDFGNHFCEYVFDNSHHEYPKFKHYPENYPSDNDIERMSIAYLTEMGQEVTEESLKNFKDEANIFTLASSMFWISWSILLASTSNINFGYLEYGLARKKFYYECKKKYFQFDDNLGK